MEEYGLAGPVEIIQTNYNVIIDRTQLTVQINNLLPYFTNDRRRLDAALRRYEVNPRASDTGNRYLHHISNVNRIMLNQLTALRDSVENYTHEDLVDELEELRINYQLVFDVYEENEAADMEEDDQEDEQEVKID